MKLKVERLSAWYGAARILFDVGFEAGSGETVALVGRNGAGKTSVMRALMGTDGLRRTGSVSVDGAETLGLEPHELARLGVGLVPEGRRVFGELSVRENLDVAAHRATAGRGRRTGGRSDGGRWPRKRVWEVFPMLERVQTTKAKWLSGGEQQILTIARALVSDPDVLLLDEPSEGLAPKVVETLVDQLLTVQRSGLTIVIAEQHRGMVEALAGRAYALERGAIAWQGPPRELFERRSAHGQGEPPQGASAPERRGWHEPFWRGPKPIGEE